MIRLQSPTTRCDHVDNVIACYFGETDGELMVGGLRVSDLAERFGTPFYLYDESVLEKRLEQLRTVYGTEFEIFYSVKANPNSQVLAFFAKRCDGLEIASEGELRKAIDAGCSPERIVFAGPGKTEQELEAALRAGVAEIHIESLTEAARIQAISKRLRQTTSIALRINPAADVQGGAMRMGGKPTPFGIDEEHLEAALDALIEMPQLVVRGIHLFAGTQILDSQVLLAQYRRCVDIAVRAAEWLDQKFNSIDFGGGLGVPYFAHERDLDLDAVAAGLKQIVERVRSHPLLCDARLMIEPGRFLAADAGIYVARVLDVKESRGKKFVVLDGGMHHHLAASGNLGQTIKRNYPIAVVSKQNDAERTTEQVDVVGPLCTPLDTLARNIALPRVEVGDLIGIFRSGAYGLTASPLGFLSHAAPAEVWISGGAAGEIPAWPPGAKSA